MSSQEYEQSEGSYTDGDEADQDVEDEEDRDDEEDDPEVEGAGEPLDNERGPKTNDTGLIHGRNNPGRTEHKNAPQLSLELLSDPANLPCHHNCPDPKDFTVSSFQDAIKIYQSCLTMHIVSRLGDQVSEVAKAGSNSLNQLEQSTADARSVLTAQVEKMNTIIQQVGGFAPNPSSTLRVQDHKPADAPSGVP